MVVLVFHEMVPTLDDDDADTALSEEVNGVVSAGCCVVVGVLDWKYCGSGCFFLDHQRQEPRKPQMKTWNGCDCTEDETERRC